MARNLFSGLLIALSSILLVASLAGIGAAWYFNEPLTGETLARLGEIESELGQTREALQDAKTELERTLRIVDSAEETLENLKDELAQAKQLLDEFDRTLGDSLIPGLENSQERLNSIRRSLEDLLLSLIQINSLPFVSLNLPGEELLSSMIETVDSIDSQIDQMKGLADKATTFAEDVSFLVGGDFAETRQRLESFLQIVGEYEQKVGGWRAQVEMWIALAPEWIDRASIILTVFLFWFALSQIGLLLHGLSLWRGENPFSVLRRGTIPTMPSPAQTELVDEEELDEDDDPPELKG
jgi:hypothetical protein